MTRDENLRRVLQHFPQGIDPGADVPVLASPDGVEVGPGLIVIVPAAENTKLRHPHKHLIVRLPGSRHQLELHPRPGNHVLFSVHQLVGREHGPGAERVVPDADSDADALLPGKGGTKLPHSPFLTDVADELTAAIHLSFVGVGDNFRILLRKYSRPGRMVKMGVGVNNGLHRLVRDLSKLRQSRFRHFFSVQGIDEHAAVPTDHGDHIRAAESCEKIHPVIDFLHSPGKALRVF